MKKQTSILIFGFLFYINITLIISSCSIEQSISSTISETVINRFNEEKLLDIPFEKEEVLKSFSGDPQILDYNTARKLALVEFLAVGFDVDMGWEGYKMNPIPVVIYGFDSKPKFYDFIVMDAEEQIAGTVSVYARRTATTVIRSISSSIKDYRTVFSKVGNFNGSLFEDWMEQSYVGLLGKAGDVPDFIINAATGEIAFDIKELEELEIIQALLNNDLYTSIFSFNNEGCEQTTETIEIMLLEALEKQSVQVEAFWTHINEFLPDIENIENEHEIIDSNGKFLSIIIKVVVKVISNLVNGLDSNPHFIPKYTDYSDSFRNTSDWCGPWAVSYLEWIRNGRTGDTYNKALTYASKFLGWFAGGEPLGSIGMNRALKEVSNDNMSISTIPIFDDKTIYNYIKDVKKPALLFCLVGDKKDDSIAKEDKDKNNKSGHWKIAVGTRASGNTAFPTYYFLFHENKTRGRNGIGNTISITTNKRDSNNEYKTVEWWNPWLRVND